MDHKTLEFTQSILAGMPKTPAERIEFLNSKIEWRKGLAKGALENFHQMDAEGKSPQEREAQMDYHKWMLNEVKKLTQIRDSIKL